MSSTLLRGLKGGIAPETLRTHFGSIDAAFEAVGYDRQQDPNVASRRWITTRAILNEAVPWLASNLSARGINTVRAGLRSLALEDGQIIHLTVPWFSKFHCASQLRINKGADALVVVDLDLPDHPHSWLVCKPNWHNRDTLILKSRTQVQKVLPWACKQEDVPERLCALIAGERSPNRSNAQR